MMLNLNESFAGLRILSLVSKPSFYREVYEAQASDGKKVYLIVYDNHNSRMLMDKKGKMKEFTMLSDMTNAAFPKPISIGSLSYRGRAMSYMTAKHFEGMTLRAMMEGKPMSVRMAVNIALQVMIAVSELIVYTNGGGHYNLNPDTVIVSRVEGGVVVHLGGLGHVAEPCSGNPPFITADLNSCCRAPETYRGRYSSASDVFSMGMLLGYLLMGYYPYNIDESATECQIRAITNSGIVPDLDDMPNELKDIVYKAVSKKKRERYANLYGMIFALSRYADENGIESKAPVISKTQESMDSDTNGNEETGEERKDEQEQSDSKKHRLKIDTKVKKGEGLKAVAGMEELKKALRRDFVDVMNNRKLAERFGIKPNNIILYGPQGCGKTYISNRLAEETGMATFTVNPSDLGSVYIHGTQGLIRELFQKAEEKAKQNHKGCLLLVDEIDAHLTKRDMSESVHYADEVAEWLVQLNDCVQKNVFVIGMTNRLDCLDRAAIRHGRFDKVFYVDLPDATGREELLRMEVGKVPHEPRIDYKSLAMMCDGFTAGDLSYVVKEAAGLTFSTCLSSHNDKLVVKETLLKEVASATRPSVTTEELRKYRSIWDEFMNKNTTQRQAIGYCVYN